ncbi:unnamed protein product [Ambrosiozyma monospora]|uniref:Unnamed protein product n=1 Tax=Ambrosiozyma monospora TaxID=43982 RepID=A0ACB5TDR2_AMBMO|nr:unnamed protein product [Ambrosiozyma monospora]
MTSRTGTEKLVDYSDLYDDFLSSSAQQQQAQQQAQQQKPHPQQPSSSIAARYQQQAHAMHLSSGTTNSPSSSNRPSTKILKGAMPSSLSSRKTPNTATSTTSATVGAAAAVSSHVQVAARSTQSQSTSTGSTVLPTSNTTSSTTASASVINRSYNISTSKNNNNITSSTTTSTATTAAMLSTSNRSSQLQSQTPSQSQLQSKIQSTTPRTPVPPTFPSQSKVTPVSASSGPTAIQTEQRQPFAPSQSQPFLQPSPTTALSAASKAMQSTTNAVDSSGSLTAPDSVNEFTKEASDSYDDYGDDDYDEDDSNDDEETLDSDGGSDSDESSDDDLSDSEIAERIRIQTSRFRQQQLQHQIATGAITVTQATKEDWETKGAAKIITNVTDANGNVTRQVVRKSIRDFKIGKELGEGSYSTVSLATDKTTGEQYAIKVLDKKHIIREKKVKYVNIEKNALNRLGKHNGIVHLHYTFQDEQSLYFIVFVIILLKLLMLCRSCMITV